MREKIVDSYEEDVVEKKRRTIHVTEHLHADVSLWHGGVKIDQVSGWTHTQPALDDALAACRRFGITAESSLRVRVYEEVTQERRVFLGNDRYGDPSYADTRFGRGRKVLSRHVWDDRDGPIETTLRMMRFRVVDVIGYDRGSVPQEAPRGFYEWASASVTNAALWRGIGAGDARIEGIEVAPTKGKDKERGVESWQRVAVVGTCPIHVPAGIPVEELASLLNDGVGIDMSRNYGYLNDLPRRWRVYSDQGISWSSADLALPVPAAIDAA